MDFQKICDNNYYKINKNCIKVCVHLIELNLIINMHFLLEIFNLLFFYSIRNVHIKGEQETRPSSRRWPRAT